MTHDTLGVDRSRLPASPTTLPHELLERRDRIVAEAERLLAASDVRRARELLAELEAGTTDQTTLDRTDGFLRLFAEGRQVVATFDPLRRPAENEQVVIYGNYPHGFANLVVNNPIRRHCADFWRLDHDLVESDRRWQGVNQIYVINVDDRLDRRDSVLRELATARAPFDRVVRISAVKSLPGSDTQVEGQLACLSSHIETLKRARDEQHQHVLVLEDDFCFTSDLDQHLSDLATFFARQVDYWVCLIATSKYGALVPKDDLLSFCYQPCTNTGGYLVSRSGIEQLLPLFESARERLRQTGNCLANAVDRCWAVLQPSGKFLVFRRKFGFQVSSFSDIERGISRYLD